MIRFLQTKFYASSIYETHKRNEFCLNQGFSVDLDHSVLLLALRVPSNITALLESPSLHLLKTTDPNKKLAQTLTLFFLGGGEVVDGKRG